MPERDQQDNAEPRQDDPVEEASEESFPASDPPSWSPLHSGAPPHDESPPGKERGNSAPKT